MSEEKTVEPLDDGLALDVIGQMLNSLEPFPQSQALVRIRGLIRETGRTCSEPASEPEPEGLPPSGY